MPSLYLWILLILAPLSLTDRAGYSNKLEMDVGIASWESISKLLSIFIIPINYCNCIIPITQNPMHILSGKKIYILTIY